MIGLNLIIHVAAAIFLGFLIWWLANLKGQLEFVRKLFWSRHVKDRSIFQVDWPASYLRRFCKALDISYEHVANSKETQPCRIDPRTLFELFYQTGISLIRYESSPGGAVPQVTVTVHDRADSSENWEESLAKAFSESCEFRLVASQIKK